MKGFSKILVADLPNFEVLLVTGIANPSSLIRFLNNKNIIFQHLNFSDHHNFSNKDIELIKSKYENLKSSKKLNLTTEKDFVRLSIYINSIYYLEIETTFLGNQKEDFDNLLINHIDQFSRKS